MESDKLRLVPRQGTEGNKSAQPRFYLEVRKSWQKVSFLSLWCEWRCRLMKGIQLCEESCDCNGRSSFFRGPMALSSICQRQNQSPGIVQPFTLSRLAMARRWISPLAQQHFNAAMETLAVLASFNHSTNVLAMLYLSGKVRKSFVPGWMLPNLELTVFHR